MKPVFYISNELDLSQIKNIMHDNLQIELSSQVKANIEHCRAYLDKKMSEGNAAIYGINTGFGSLCNTVVAPHELTEVYIFQNH
jgi:histidine ammonia-lyase